SWLRARPVPSRTPRCRAPSVPRLARTPIARRPPSVLALTTERRPEARPAKPLRIQGSVAHGGMYDYGRVTFVRRTRRAPLASAGRVHRRDDGDRESPVRVDTVHDSTDASAARHAVSGADRVHALHPHGDLARALRRLARRPCRRASGGVG